MENQMFSPQENEPERQEEKQASSDSGEQGQENETPPQLDDDEYGSYEQGYRGYNIHTEGEKLRPAQSISSRQWIWIIIAVVVLLIILGSVLNEILGSLFFLVGLVVVGYVIWRLAFNRAVPLPMQAFEVSGRQSVSVDNPFGAVRIHQGSASAVEHLTQSNLVQFRDNYLVAKNCVLGVFGNVKAAEVKNLFERLLADGRSTTAAPDAICIVDADCEVSPNLLRALSARIAAGADAEANRVGRVFLDRPGPLSAIFDDLTASAYASMLFSLYGIHQ